MSVSIEEIMKCLGVQLQIPVEFVADSLEKNTENSVVLSSIAQSPALAKSDEVSFVSSKKYAPQIPYSNAALLVVKEISAESCKVPFIVVDDPYLAYAKISTLFIDESQLKPEIHPSAFIHSSASIGKSVSVAANVSISSHAEIADNVEIGAGCYIGEGVNLGKGTRLHANVSIYHDVVLGADCLIHSGTVIGCDGFGFAPTSEGFVKIHHLGSVIVGDRVEIGANCAIDRGALGNTQINNGVKIDNLVHISHNSCIGENTALAGQVGMAGSTNIGKNCAVGGQVGFAGHIDIADGVQITGKAMITSSIKKRAVYSSGTGFSESKQWRKNAVRFNQLDELARRIKQLEKKFNESIGD